MRPYLAVIKDSFREAIDSWMLYIVLVLITLLLAAVAPLTVQPDNPALLVVADFQDRQGLARMIAEARGPEAGAPHRVRSLLSQGFLDSLSETLADLDKGEGPFRLFPLMNQLRQELNGLLPRTDFYTPEAFGPPEKLPQEVRELLARPAPLSERDQMVLNRRLMEYAFPGRIEPMRGAAYVWWYVVPIGDPMPISPEGLRQILMMVITGTMSWILGAFGVITAIVVTAPTIPSMFEAGSIDLLLSKPVSRSLLFVSKFVGGCVFTFLTFSYMIVGLWLILGMRFGIWSTGLLLCIPVFLFVYAIYFSVSCLAGAVWRNSIISVILVVVFWGVCFSLKTVRELVEVLAINPTRLQRVLLAGESLVATNLSGQNFVWSDENRNWKPIFDGEQFQQALGQVYPFLGPVYDPAADQLVLIQQDGLRSRSQTLFLARRADDWTAVRSIELDVVLEELFVDAGGVVGVGAGGVFRLEGDPAQPHQPFKLFGFDLNRNKQSARFAPVLEGRTGYWGGGLNAAMSAADGRLLVTTPREAHLLERLDDGRFAAARRVELSGSDAPVPALAPSAALLARTDGTIQRLDPQTLEVRASWTPFGKERPRAAAFSPDGRRAAVLFENRRAWVYDLEADRPIASVRGQGDLSALAFAGDGTLLAADANDRVRRYNLETGAVDTFDPPATTVEWLYSYAILPLYTVFPKPSQLDDVVLYLLTDSQAVDVPGQRMRPRDERPRIDFWTPLWSNTLFLAVMLGLGCWRIEWRDF